MPLRENPLHTLVRGGPMATPVGNPAVRPVEGRGPSDSDGVQTWRLRFAQCAF